MKQPFHEYQQQAPVIILVTAPSSSAADFMPDIEAPSNYADPLKIIKYVDEKATKFLAKAAFGAMTGQVAAAITYHRSNGKEYAAYWLNQDALGPRPMKHEDTETEAVSENKEVLFQYFEDERHLLANLALFFGRSEGLIGQNLHGFILPFLIRRMLKHRISIDERFLPRPRYFDQSVCFDTMQAWGMGQKDQEFVSMKHLIQHLELDGPMPGVTMPLAFTEAETFVDRYAKDPTAALDDLTYAAELTHLVASVLWGASTTRDELAHFNSLVL